MSDLVGNPEDRFSHNEAHMFWYVKHKERYLNNSGNLLSGLHTCGEMVGWLVD